MDQIVNDFSDSLVRSSQEPGVVKANQCEMNWTMLVFKRGENLFWHFVIKSNSYGQDTTERIFTLTVTTNDRNLAASEIQMLREKYLPGATGPGFFMLKDLRNPKRIPIRAEYLLSDADLDLHYGQDFGAWSSRLEEGLSLSGLSILRGKPGTGKTSFLRHLICKLSLTHRFYYIPVDGYHLLQSGLTDFLVKEQRAMPEFTLVLVLEDAEQLLLDRRGFKEGLASSLLNLTDGFVGDMVKTHLICTINSEMQDLDEAVLRPGRQRFFREFELLTWAQASALAQHLEITLTEKRSYSLAEIFHYKDTQSKDRLQQKPARIVGFGP